MTEEYSRYYAVDEAARVLELSPACVRQMLRAGELEGERRGERIEGVLGPWRIPERAVSTLKGDPGVLRAKRRTACVADATTTAELSPSLGEEVTVERAPSEPLPTGGEGAGADGPSEVAELLSESVGEVREKAEALRRELELLEGRLEAVEMTELALREALRREKEKADGLRAELEAERARGRRGDPREDESGRWLSKG